MSANRLLSSQRRDPPPDRCNTTPVHPQSANLAQPTRADFSEELPEVHRILRPSGIQDFQEQGRKEQAHTDPEDHASSKSVSIPLSTDGNCSSTDWKVFQMTWRVNSFANSRAALVPRARTGVNIFNCESRWRS